VVFGVATILGAANAARAAPCPVPTPSHPSIQSAVDDPGCTEIVLGSQLYLESVEIDRTLSVTGVSSGATTIVGRVLISGATSAVSLSDLAVDVSDPAMAGLFVDALDVQDGAQMAGSDIVVVNSGVFFADGFEDGTTGSWSHVVP
jgi:hypothetical protein